MFPANNTASIENATINHLDVDLNTLSAIMPPTGASIIAPYVLTTAKPEDESGSIPSTFIRYGIKYDTLAYKKYVAITRI